MKETPCINPHVTVPPELSSRAHDVLRKFYGYSSFRSHQLAIISTVMEGKDAVVLMPTGGGKSICYQLPALMLPGCAVVISPLISLMKDQVLALQANGIPAATINSTQSDVDNRRIMDLLYQGRLKLLYISPERFMLDIPRLSSHVNISLFAIDEAHCISQWGHDFRPVYTQLSTLRETYPNVPLLALTATADRLTRDDIARQLGLNNYRLFISSFDRPNISLTVMPAPDKRGKISLISSLIDKYSRDSGIVYCISRKKAQQMAEALRDKGFKVAVYHAGLSADERNLAQQQFINGEVHAVCATVAFGMGIDKSNIRWVVHNNMPRNIESYYQEIGRAGRDGLPAEAVMFYSFGDLITLEGFVMESGQVELNREKLDRMKAFAEATVCRRRMLLSYFNETMEHDCGNCDVCHNPPSRIDGTTPALKAMSAAIRSGQQVGIQMLVDILRGSARADLVQAGWHQLKTYGAGRDMSHAEWIYYIGQMVQLGIFEVAYEESNHLKVTPFGRKVLGGQAKVELSQYVHSRPRTRAKAKTVTVTLTPDQRLLNALKDTRDKLAKRAGIAPYMVLSDASLDDIVKKKPVTLDEFAAIEGVSEHKLVRYWRQMVTTVCKATGQEPPSTHGNSEKETLLLLHKGFNVDQIAEIKGIKPYTVYTHLVNLVNNDKIDDFSGLITRTQYLTVINTRDKHPDDFYDYLRDILPPGLPRLAIAINDYLARHPRQ